MVAWHAVVRKITLFPVLTIGTLSNLLEEIRGLNRAGHFKFYHRAGIFGYYIETRSRGKCLHTDS